jgi:methyl-accepting chemotaxis protein
MSIRVRFLVLIAVLSLLATIAIAYASYQFSLNNAVEEAKSKGQIVFDYLDSSRLYFKKHMRPKVFEILPRGQFIPELISGFTLTRGVSDEFQKKNPDYIFKQATIDPLHLANKADKDDLKIIETLKKNPSKKFAEGMIKKKGEEYYYFAHPIKIESKKCLRCHGNPKNAPKEQVETYGTEHGYNWKLGDIASAYVVYVPLQKAFAQAKQSAIKLVAIGAAGIILMMLILWIFFSMYVIKPISMLEKRATEISLGKNLSEPILTPSDDEIGSLARSVDRLRISVEKMLQRFKR